VNVVYVETSALAAWLFGQTGGNEMRSTVDGADAVVTSLLTFAEAERALIRSERGGRLRGGDVQRIRGHLERIRASWIAMAISEEILTRAGQGFPIEPLRTLDAIHLATALVFARAFPELRVLALDRRVRKNAESLGLS
jgi:hypothetical protein